MAFTILVADDEQNITDVCKRYLELEGYRVVIANDGEEALEIWRKESPNLLILDLMMPKKDGFAVCEEIRTSHDTPVILLTALGEERDRLLGLAMGADDYMVKPFSPRELVLRVKAIMRRIQRTTRADKHSVVAIEDWIHYADLEISPSLRQVKVAGREVELTVKEFDLLHLFVMHPEQVFSRNQLLNRLWDIDFFGDTTTVTVHIRRLREKIEINPSQPQYVKTVWGVGYKFGGRDRS
jgi:two-component system response regulator VicR